VAKTAAAKSTAAKTTSAKSASSRTTASRTTASKTVAAKAAAEKSAAAKSASKTTAARTSAAKTAAAKAAATKAAAAKAAAAEAAEAEAAAAKNAEAESAGTSQVGEPAVEQPAVEQPVVDEPVVEEPVVEEPAVESAPVDEAVAEEISTDEQAADDHVDERSASDIDEAVTDGDAADQAVSGVSAASATEAIRIRGLVKTFGDHTAVNGIDLTVPAGSFYGIVGPNGAGKTTTLSIVAGLLRADEGEVVICGIDQAAKPLAAKRMMGVLPDRLRTFDRLTGRQLLYYYGLLRGLTSDVIEKRVGDLGRAFDLGEALNRVVSDYSAGMTKKIMLAGAMIHSPRVLVLDEPFEAVDPVSSAVILDILRAYVAHGGTVILSSHGMDLVERVCSRVAIIVGGDVLAEGTIDEVRAGQTLEARFVELSGGIGEVEGLEWLHTFSD
ncbi:ABC transporter ATP-binding protein, partial [Microbacterium sp. ISL-103]|uniref:ABC transporter ATP-binding protein n=1 Tax=Microbacterium sp. ISL-103 TaxID=2819156 RepID=UPI00288B34FC